MAVKKKNNPNHEVISDETKSTPEKAEIIDNLPPELKKVMEFSMHRYTGPMPNPLISKITPEHIEKIIDASDKSNERAYVDAKSTRKYALTYVIIGVLFIVFLVLFLVERDKELLNNIIERGVLIIAGFAGGYGFKAYMEKNEH